MKLFPLILIVVLIGFFMNYDELVAETEEKETNPAFQQGVEQASLYLESEIDRSIGGLNEENTYGYEMIVLQRVSMALMNHESFPLFYEGNHKNVQQYSVFSFNSDDECSRLLDKKKHVFCINSERYDADEGDLKITGKTVMLTGEEEIEIFAKTGKE